MLTSLDALPLNTLLVALSARWDLGERVSASEIPTKSDRRLCFARFSRRSPRERDPTHTRTQERWDRGAFLDNATRVLKESSPSQAVTSLRFLGSPQISLCASSFARFGLSLFPLFLLFILFTRFSLSSVLDTMASFKILAYLVTLLALTSTSTARLEKCRRRSTNGASTRLHREVTKQTTSSVAGTEATGWIPVDKVRGVNLGGWFIIEPVSLSPFITSLVRRAQTRVPLGD